MRPTRFSQQNSLETIAGHEPPAIPRLSVVVAAVDPWPAARTCLESLVHQSSAGPIEIIVADGDGNALPADQVPSSVRWLRKPGGSIFQMRALGLAAARGEIIAFTEDHCRVAPDWCRSMLELHDRYPHAGGIGGAVENGADRSILDRTHFLIAYGPFMLPNHLGPSRDITGQANVSFKRRVLLTKTSADGVHQMEMNRELLNRGIELRMDDQPVVWHIQSLGLAGTCRMHFHTGRCIAGFRLPRLSVWGRILRIVSCAILPAFLAARTALIVLKKKRFRISLACGLPFLLLFVSCHALGELSGYLTGPGNSPQMAR
jgi:hypothetical protein